jgi:hypothetical protein
MTWPRESLPVDSGLPKAEFLLRPVQPDKRYQTVGQGPAPIKVIVAAVELAVGDGITLEEKNVSQFPVDAEQGIEATDLHIEFDWNMRTVTEGQDQITGISGEWPRRRIPIAISDPVGTRLRENVSDDIRVIEGAVTGGESTAAGSGQDHMAWSILDAIVCADPGYQFERQKIREGSVTTQVAVALTHVVDENCDHGADFLCADQVIQDRRSGYQTGGASVIGSAIEDNQQIRRSVAVIPRRGVDADPPIFIQLRALEAGRRHLSVRHRIACRDVRLRGAAGRANTERPSKMFELRGSGTSRSSEIWMVPFGPTNEVSVTANP